MNDALLEPLRAVPRFRLLPLQSVRTLVTAFFVLTTFVANGGLNLPSQPPQAGYGVVDAFPGLRFDQPVGIVTAPGDTKRLFILERTGRVMVITNLAEPTKSVFLDLRASTSTAIAEEGLLGMAFHPKFSENGHFYVYRTFYGASHHGPVVLHNQLSRFTVSPEDPDRCSPSSEVRLLAQLDFTPHHNGGDLKFGPDGYLYLSTGHEGSMFEDISPHYQAIDKGLFGAVLRIDVDRKRGNLPPRPHALSSTNYFIPADNPFVGVTRHNGIEVDPDEVRTEIFAVGFRNPWKMNFHPTTGALFVGDVGENYYEEINEVLPGGNYGWPYLEANNRTGLSAPTQADFIRPAIGYAHGNGIDRGNCVVGGLFYQGTRIPQLSGKYIFGDFTKGHIWAAAYIDNGLQPTLERLTGQVQITCFGEDPRDGEILMTNFEKGMIHKLVYRSPESAPSFPEKLSETGVFVDLVNMTPANAVIPYEINHAFWSDNAQKHRWFVNSSDGSKIEFSPTGNWSFPSGTVWIKHFEIDVPGGTTRKRLETRFLVKTEGGGYGVTYRWNSEGTEAYLVSDEGADEPLEMGEVLPDQVWHYPSRAECMSCHTDAGGVALGFNTDQLNRATGVGVRAENQIIQFLENGHISGAEVSPARLPKVNDRDESNASLHDRARSYLAVNCSFCHQPATLKARLDTRLATPFSRLGMIPGGPVVTPRNSSGSILMQRLRRTDGTRMPPIGSNVHDEEGIALLAQWIDSFPPAPWKLSDIGTHSREGGASFVEGAIELSTSGSGIMEMSDQLTYLHLPASNNVSVTVRITFASNASSNVAAGVAFRSSLAAGAASAFIGISPSQSASALTRIAPGEKVTVHTGPAGKYQWVQLSKENSRVSLRASEDGMDWQTIAEENIEFPNTFLIGLTAGTGGEAERAFVTYNDLRIVSVAVDNQLEESRITASEPLRLSASVNGIDTSGVKVRFYVDEEFAGEAVGPYEATWSHTTAGFHSVYAEAEDLNGTKVRSKAVAIAIDIPPARAWFAGEDVERRGDWLENYGEGGRNIPGEGGLLMLPTLNHSISSEIIPLSEAQADSRALMHPAGDSRFEKTWQSEQIRIGVTAADGLVHRLALYFVDWDDEDLRLNVTIRDSATGEILNERTVSDFTEGVYHSWLLRGEIEVIISGLNGKDASLTGYFMDPQSIPRPTIKLLEPLNGLTATVPTAIRFLSETDSKDAPVVEYHLNGKKLGQSTSEPYQFSWSTAFAGSHTVIARAFDEWGFFTDSEPHQMRLSLPGSAAKFAGADAEMQGDWLEQIGTEAFLLPAYSIPNTEWLELSPRGHYEVTWSYPSMSEARAPLTPAGNGRIASAYYSSRRFELDASFKDGRRHRVSFYFLDWDRALWRFKVRVLGANGELLDQREVSDFEEGVYYSWDVQGKVTFEFQPLNYYGFAVVSGIFVDPAPVLSDAIFHQMDSTTGGNWRERYGRDGYSMLVAGTNIPPSMQATVEGHLDFAWTLDTDEPRALEGLVEGTRLAPAWYSDTAFEFRIRADDSAWHQLSLYCIDWDYGRRSQRMSILDGEDRSILDSQILTNFHGGKYFSWNFRGEVIARVESIEGNAVTSALFLDPLSNREQWRLSHAVELAPEDQQLMNDDADPDGDGIPNLLEYKLGLSPFSYNSSPVVPRLQDGVVMMSVRVNPSASDVRLQFESSPDLLTWTASTRVLLKSEAPGEENNFREYEIIGPLRELRFYRLKAVR